MRLLFLALDVNLGRRAGDATHVRELASNLVSLGNEIDLIVEGGDAESFDSARIRIHRPNTSSTLRTIREAVQIARASNVNVIYERRLTPKIGLVVSRIVRRPLIAEVNGLADEEKSLQSIGRSRPSSVRRWMRARILKRARNVVAVSPGIREVLVRTYRIDPSKVVVIPNGVNLDLFRPLDREAARKELDIPLEDFVVGFAGLLAPWQGVDNLLRAVAYIQNRSEDVKALIVGDGPERDRLVRLSESLGIGRAVRFVGSVPYADVPRYIATFNIAFCVKPPGLSGSPLKIREYMACGRPVIATAGTAYDFEVVEQAAAGILVDPRQTDSTVDAILRLRNDRALAERLGLSGRLFAERSCSWVRTAERVVDVCSR